MRFVQFLLHHFGHGPSLDGNVAVSTTCAAARRRFGGRRVWEQAAGLLLCCQFAYTQGWVVSVLGTLGTLRCHAVPFVWECSGQPLVYRLKQPDLGMDDWSVMLVLPTRRQFVFHPRSLTALQNQHRSGRYSQRRRRSSGFPFPKYTDAGWVRPGRALCVAFALTRWAMPDDAGAFATWGAMGHQISKWFLSQMASWVKSF